MSEPPTKAKQSLGKGSPLITPTLAGFFGDIVGATDRAPAGVMGASDELTSRSLRTTTGPGGDCLVSAPPVLNASDHTIDYVCGACGTVLMHADEGQVHNLAILCASCGAYNSTDG